MLQILFRNYNNLLLALNVNIFKTDINLNVNCFQFKSLFINQDFAKIILMLHVKFLYKHVFFLFLRIFL